MSYWNEMYYESYLSEQTNIQTVISLKLMAKTGFWTKCDRYIDQNVKLIKQLIQYIFSCYFPDLSHMFLIKLPVFTVVLVAKSIPLLSPHSNLI